MMVAANDLPRTAGTSIRPDTANAFRSLSSQANAWRKHTTRVNKAAHQVLSSRMGIIISTQSDLYVSGKAEALLRL